MPPRQIIALLLFACLPAMAQQPAPSALTPATRAALRYPQPVQVGSLIQRQVLRPVEQQNVLGRVASVVRQPDGAVLVVINIGGVFGLGTRPVAVPVEAIALLGKYVALMDLTPEQLQALPTFTAANTQPLQPDQMIKVGLTRPFH